jgi:hypothetical protein
MGRRAHKGLEQEKERFPSHSWGKCSGRGERKHRSGDGFGGEQQKAARGQAGHQTRRGFLGVGSRSHPSQEFFRKKGGKRNGKALPSARRRKKTKRLMP